MTETYLERITTFVWGFSDNIYTGQFFLKYSQEGGGRGREIRWRNRNVSYLDFIIAGQLRSQTKVGFSLSSLEVKWPQSASECWDISHWRLSLPAVTSQRQERDNHI